MTKVKKEYCVDKLECTGAYVVTPKTILLSNSEGMNVCNNNKVKRKDRCFNNNSNKRQQQQ